MNNISKPLDIRSWERFNVLLSTHNKVNGRILVIANAQVPVEENATLTESSIKNLEFKYIESFILDSITGESHPLNISYGSHAFYLHRSTTAPAFVIIDVIGLSIQKLLYLTSYFSQISIPVVLYSGDVKNKVDLNLLAKISCYCFIAMNSDQKISVFTILRNYVQNKLTSVKAPVFNQIFSTRTFFDKISQKWRNVVYGIQNKKRKKGWNRKNRTTKKYNEFNKKKP